MLTIPWIDKTVSIDGMNVRFWDVGESSDTVVLIHGLGGSIEQWFANIDLLSDTYRVVCVDMPGCGKTDSFTNNDYSLRSVSQFIDKFLNIINVSSFSLIGLSMGGAVCLQYTLDYPQKVRKLVLAGSAALGIRMAFVFRVLTLPFVDMIPGLLSRSQFAFYVRSMVYDHSVITDDIIDFYYPLMKAENTRKSFLRMLKTSCSIFGLKKEVHTGVIKRLSEIKQPVQIIWGKQDHYMPFANVGDAMKKIDNVKLVLLDHCAHNPQFEKADEFNSAVLEFLKS